MNNAYIVQFLLSISDQGLDGDNEFDLIGTDSPQPRIHEPTVFHAKRDNDNVTYNDESDDILFDMQDSRIKSLVEMGFSDEQAKEALIACNNDVNEALTLLLSS